MALKAADVLAKASALEGKLAGKRFLGGDKPSAEDVKEFEALLGAGNLGLFRWVKHMASFSAQERGAWGAPVKPAKAPAKADAPKAGAAAAAASSGGGKPAPKGKAAAPKKAAAPAADDDDDFDVFGEETEEELAAKAAKKAADEKAAAEKKAKEKKKPIAKSSILMGVSPYDDETDLEALYLKIKAIEHDGVLWGAHKLAPIAFGLKQLQIMITIEDDKVPTDDLEELITQFEDEVQSVQILAFNKI